MKPLHVLVVHRDAGLRDELVGLLRRGDHTTVAAASAGAAAEAMATDVDAVLLDLNLTDLDVGALRRALSPSGTPEPDSLEAAERRHLSLVLHHTAGNKRKAAHILGISRSTLLNKVRKYGLEVQVVVGLFTCAMLAGAPAQAQQNRPVGDGRVISGTLSFDGHATAGDFTGSTDSVSGQLKGAPELTGVRGWVEAPVGTLKTGNGKRDKDLNKSMESEKYPVMRFNLARVTRNGGSADSVGVTLHGTLQLHGVTRNVELPATIQFSGSNARVRTNFPLNLKDYRIGGLSKLLGMLKMYENIKVHTDLVFQLGAGG